MAKIVYLRAKEEAQPEYSPAYKGLITWLESRPKNTRNHYRGILNEWSKFLGYEPTDRALQRALVAAKHIDVQKWVNELKERPAQSGRAREASNGGKISMASVRHKVIVMRAIYDELIAQGFAEGNPFERLAKELKKHEAGQRRPHLYIPPAAVKKLIDLDVDRQRPEEFRDLMIFKIFFGAALRRGEVCALQIGDVKRSDSGSVYLRLRATKSGKIQNVTLAPWVANPLIKFLDMRAREGAVDSDPLFIVYRVNGRVTAISDSTVYRIFKRYCAELGLSPDFTPHCARATAITKMLEDGFSHREVQQLSRHASITMVEKYDKRRVEIDHSPSKKLKY